MEEVLREYVRGNKCKQKKDDFTLTMVNKDENGIPDLKLPVVLLNGK